MRTPKEICVACNFDKNSPSTIRAVGKVLNNRDAEIAKELRRIEDMEASWERIAAKKKLIEELESSSSKGGGL